MYNRLLEVNVKAQENVLLKNMLNTALQSAGTTAEEILPEKLEMTGIGGQGIDVSSPESMKRFMLAHKVASELSAQWKNYQGDKSPELQELMKRLHDGQFDFAIRMIEMDAHISRFIDHWKPFVEAYQTIKPVFGREQDSE